MASHDSERENMLLNESEPRPLASLKVLIVDDQEPMRRIVQASLSRLGVRDVVLAGSAQEALVSMQSHAIDLVLCDYWLGVGTDGQQLLEAARGARLLNPLCPWIFVTANSNRSAVMAAGDYAPDAYIVKPFDDRLLLSYIASACARKSALAPLLLAVDAGKWEQALEIAEHHAKRSDVLRVEGIRYQAHALMKLGRFEEARQACSSALRMNSELGWASLGRAQALRALGQVGLARAAVERLVKDQPDYAAAYDALLDMLDEQGDQDAALAIAQAAADLVPNAKRKLRLGTVALRAGRPDVAVTALEQAVARNRHSVTRSHREGVLLAQALVDSGDPARALAVATEVARHYPGHAAAQTLCKAIHVQGLAQGGSTEEATALMDDIESSPVPAALDDDGRLLLAKTALAAGRVAFGRELVETVARNNTDKPLMLAAALRVADGSAQEDACKQWVERAGAEVEQALRDLRQAKRDGDFARAIAVAETALAQSPKHFTVLIELCTLYLVAMPRLGQAEEHAARALALLAQLEECHPNHDRVAAARRFCRERLVQA